MNPLLDFQDLPQFDRITPADVAPAIDTLLRDADVALARVTSEDFPAQWLSISSVLDVATERLSRAWGAINHLNGVADTPELRATYNAMLPRVTDFFTRLGADERLYAKYKQIPADSLTPEQLQAQKNSIRNFVLGGAELRGAQRERFGQIQERLAELSQKFSENALDATDAFTYLATDDEVAGLPDDVRLSARALAQANAQEGYMLTLKQPCYLPVMQFARDRSLRQRLYRAYVTRASEQAAPELRKFDNSAVIAEILALRKEEASLLGYPNFGELSMVPKMAQSTDHVIGFLTDLAARSRPFAERDMADMRAFAAAHLDLPDPQAWDWTFIGERLKESRFAFSEQEVKKYFPAPKVLSGLFKIVETLFDVSIARDQAATWHPAVEFYRIERQLPGTAASPGKTQLLGRFYLDPGARNGKRSGAWMDDVCNRWLRPDSGALQTPVAHLVCNFSEGADGAAGTQQPLLSHRDVITLFHECGHGLQHLLTQVDEHDVSGISGVEWDAVEVPSQFMENFCWEWNVLKHMSAHEDTGAPLPRELFEKMRAARNFQTGLQTLRQIEFGLFDMLLHTRHDPAQEVMPLLQQVRDQVAVLQTPAWNRSAHTFSHIFAGGYAAGYYSYKWAEVLSADAYAAFEETASQDGLPNAQTGRKYREAILEVGGSRPALESFKAFRGREPTLDALLRHQGMA